jgi:hypothetical protein
MTPRASSETCTFLRLERGALPALCRRGSTPDSRRLSEPLVLQAEPLLAKLFPALFEQLLGCLLGELWCGPLVDVEVVVDVAVG